MKTRKLHIPLLLLLLASLTLGGLSPTAAQDAQPPRQPPRRPDPSVLSYGSEEGPEFKPGEVLVKFKADTPGRSVDSLLTSYQATRLETLDVVDVEVWQVEEGRELSTIKQLEANPAVEYAEPNYRYYALGIPNDPDFTKQWGLTTVQAPSAWDVTQGSNSTVIAIIDSGIDASHPDLAGKIVGGWDFVDNDSTPQDENGHGTHVAGIAAAVTNNGVGVAGMSWSARIMPVRVLDNTGSGYNSAIVSGINWAWQQGAKVLSLSLGGISPSSSMQAAINAAHAAGSLVVAAMGNCRESCTIGTTHYSNPTMYPAAYDNVMAVAATGPGDVYAYYSQYGPHCDIAAPGGEIVDYAHLANGIYSTLPTYPVYLNTAWGYSMNYDFLQGTSQATPFVSGLAALVWATNPSLGPDDVQAVIEGTAVDLGVNGWDSDYGWGRIDASAAVHYYSIPEVPILSDIGPADGTGSYLVDWNDIANATSYVLEEAGNPAFGPATTVYTGTVSQYSASLHAPGTWYYHVLARNNAGDSAWSNIASVTVRPDPPILNAISNAGHEDAYLISWLASTAATQYTLMEDDNPSFSSPVARYIGPALQYTVTGQASGDWYYRVIASNSAGDSDPSTIESTTVDPPPPGTPGIPVLNPIVNVSGSDAYLVDWDAAVGATGYILEQSQDPWFSAPTEVYTGTATEYSVTNQPKGTWYYRVRASASAGNSPWSATQSTAVLTRIYLPMVEKPLVMSEGFESGLVPPPGWEPVVHDSSLPTRTWFVNTERPYAGAYYASCDYDPDRLQDEVLLSPEATFSSATVRFRSFGSIYYCRDVEQNCRLEVWLVVGT